MARLASEGGRLDITERRKPQNGRIDLSRFAGVPVELRVATVPTTGGKEEIGAC